MCNHVLALCNDTVADSETAGEFIGDPVEIDAASNNGVDSVRQIIKSASERSIDGQYKIYIIDECHMISVQGWNAFLKCIEEPPAYTIFIFCTTDPQKIPPTIINRVQKFNFNRISSSVICDRLKYICSREGYTNYLEACDYISRICNGQMRDAISYVEKCAGYSSDLSIQNVLYILGEYSYETMFKLVNAIIDADEVVVLSCIDSIYNSGGDLKLFVSQFLSFVLDIQKYVICKSIALTRFPGYLMETLDNSINFDNANQYYAYITTKLLELKNTVRTDLDPKPTIEVTFLTMCRLQ